MVQRLGSTSLVVERAIDFAHAPGAEVAEDLIMVQPGAGLQRHKSLIRAARVSKRPYDFFTAEVAENRNHFIRRFGRFHRFFNSRQKDAGEGGVGRKEDRSQKTGERQEDYSENSERTE